MRFSFFCIVVINGIGKDVLEKSIVVIGGGAAGFFAAIRAKEVNPKVRCSLYEKGHAFLTKVRISGGGRCNVTHACFEPKSLMTNYPRGSRELLGPMIRFGPREMVDWLKERGVELKTEGDGRMFPVSNVSTTIIDLLRAEAKRLGVVLFSGIEVKDIRFADGSFQFRAGQEEIVCTKLLLATGSVKGGYALARSLGHTIDPLMPTLFTFHIPKSDLRELSGLSMKKVKVSIGGTKLVQEGPILLTHKGFSGPAIIKLSGYAAKNLNDTDYQANLVIDWLPEISEEELKKRFEKELVRCNEIPKKLWSQFLGRLGITESEATKKQKNKFIAILKRDVYRIEGKSPNKEEFVTSGGVNLKEVNFKTMESKKVGGLFFAGEILNIDGITGGFNFQNAWTTGWIAGSSM